MSEELRGERRRFSPLRSGRPSGAMLLLGYVLRLGLFIAAAGFVGWLWFGRGGPRGEGEARASSPARPRPPTTDSGSLQADPDARPTDGPVAPLAKSGGEAHDHDLPRYDLADVGP